MYAITSSDLNKENRGNAATGEVETCPVCHFYVAEPCELVFLNKLRQRAKLGNSNHK